jgi:uncharacterized protein (TIGR02145 family)
MKKYLFTFLFLFAFFGCQDEETVPVSPTTQTPQTLAKKDKVVICHLNDEGVFIPIEISINALPAHLAHGDYLPDADGDGYTAVGACTGSMNDCNDNDSTIHPGALEVCDEIDNNCDGQIDEGLPTNTYYLDNDQDGYGDPNISLTKCSQPAGYVTVNGDCDDNDANINPGSAEICDEIDNNCNGLIDEGLPFEIYFADCDNDGYGNPSITLIKCLQPAGYVTNGDDCNDNNSMVNPNATEVCGDNIDNDCDGEIDEGCEQPCGTLTVDYEGKIYHTVQIGNQCWMKENLDVGTRINGIQNQTNNSILEKYCYGDNVSNCNTYGGLHQWNEAMQYVTTQGAKGICPTGWHIPTYTDFFKLRNAVGGNGNALKANGQGSGSGTGTNTSGFGALLAGDRLTNGIFSNLGIMANFQTSTDCYPTMPYIMTLQYNSFFIGFYGSYQDTGYSVRCLKN